MNRTRRAEHEAALARRLELLGEEVASYGGPGPSGRRTGRHGSEPLRSVPPSPPSPPSSPTSSSTPPTPPALPQPGRHVARRAGRLSRLLPDSLQGRVALGPGTLAVVAVAVAAGLAVTAWWVVRSEPTLVAPVEPRSAPALASPATPTETVPGGVAATPGDTVTVDVAGKVRRPGIAVLDAGARVVDALRAAGGARAGVDLTGLNLARVLADGEQIVVGLPAAATAPPPAPVGGSTPGGPLVDLNTATTVELEGLPEVGPVTAQAIVTWRDQHGGFTAVAELLEVDGIGDATLATIAPFVTV